MSQRTTDASSIMYHSTLLACKEEISGDELHVFLTEIRKKLQNHEYIKTNSVQTVRRPSLTKNLGCQ